MRTNIDLDDALMEQAMRATGMRTKKAAVEASLRKLVSLKTQEKKMERAFFIQERTRKAALRKGRSHEWQEESAGKGNAPEGQANANKPGD